MGLVSKNRENSEYRNIDEEKKLSLLRNLYNSDRNFNNLTDLKTQFGLSRYNRWGVGLGRGGFD
jgi:hypothetical protein